MVQKFYTYSKGIQYSLPLLYPRNQFSFLSSSKVSISNSNLLGILPEFLYVYIRNTYGNTADNTGYFIQGL